MPTISSDSQLVHRAYYPWLVWSLGATFFFAEYFVHVSLGVMLPQLMAVFHVGAHVLGSLSALFWYPYMMMQVPVGALVDRFGPHRLLVFSSAMCAIACGLFAMANALWIAELARFLIGFSSSFAFISTLKLAKIWFPANRFGFLAGLTQSVGMLGAVFGEGPIAFAVTKIGWRGTLWWMGGFLLLLSFLIYFLIRERPKAMGRTKTQVASFHQLWQGTLAVMRNPQSWINGMFVGLLFAPTSAFGELWGVNYFVRNYGISQALAASAMGSVFIGWAIAGPLAGRLSDRLKKRKPVMIASAVASCITLSIALYWPHLPITLLFFVLFLYGVSNTGLGVGYALAGEINAAPVSGVSMAFSNMASVIIGAFFQPLIGMLLELRWDHLIVNGIPIYSASAYRWAMLPLVFCLLGAVGFACWVRETQCLPLEDRPVI